ncbi:MAG: hypothetical protein MPK07_01115 [Alphaproteobacteria bacterium]|nr:hypothetical protein [Alphaproteobacteria bacterium]MDA8012519.1 hypothetical protein [Alphaproteobacteria bacterium]
MSKSALIATLIAALSPRVREKPAASPAKQPSREEWAEEAETNAKIFFGDEFENLVSQGGDGKYFLIRKGELKGLIAQGHKGKYALMHKGKVVTVKDDYHFAYVEGKKRYPGDVFSVHHVMDEPLYLGTLGPRVA